MRKLLLLALLYFLLGNTYAQPWLENLPQKKSESTYTYYEHVNAFNEYWKPFNVNNKGYYLKNGVKTKAAGWKQFNRWAYNMEGQINSSTGEFPKQSAQQVYSGYLKANPKTKAGLDDNWTNLGVNSSDGGYSGIGRINCIAFHPSDNNTYWVGAPAGGLWVTTDNGSNWACLTDQNAVLGISDIVIPSDYATTNTIYIATGDRDAWDNTSVGVLKSTNGGTTWNTTGLAYSIGDYKMISRLLLDPNDDNTIIAATKDGVYKTTNGGTSWSTQLTSTYFIDMEYKPGAYTTMYGSTENGSIYRSTNSGADWTQTFTDSDARRIELAVSPNDATVVYAIAAASDDGLYGVYKSSNSGSAFTKTFDGTTTGNNLLGWYSDGSNTTGQGWYDLSIAVSPSDATKVIIGGVNSHKSTDGGTTWSCANCWTSYSVYNKGNHPEVHADKHMLIYRSNGDLFECNDGGIYISSNDGTAWTDKSDGLVISQLYKLGVSQTVANEVITGLQDNGSKLYSGGTWTDVKGGDGMECIIDYTNVDIQYATYTKGQITRTKDHWSTATDIEPSGAGDGAWVTPYIIDPTDNATIYAGYADVWKTTNKGDDWTKISSMNTSNKLRSMAIANSNTQIIFVADQKHIWKTTNGGTAWTDITGTLPVAYSYITNMAVKNNDANTIWLTLSGYNSDAVYESTNGGSAWSNISGTLPELPAYSIVQNTQITTEVHLYVGTELGIYFKKGNDDWLAYNTALPNVKIGELEIYYDATPANSKLRAATYGRGLWETPIEQATVGYPAVVTNAVTNITLTAATSGGNVSSEGSSSITERGVVYNTSGTPNLNDTKLADASVGTGSYTSSLTGLSTATTYYIRAFATNTLGTSYGDELVFTTNCNLPTITAQPVNVSANEGDNVSFTVEATGVSLEYQWRFEKVDISEAKQNKLTLSNVSIENQGNYDVVVSNDCGEITSNEVSLSITTSINDLAEYGISIYPNPSNGIFKIFAEKITKDIEVIVINYEGRIIYNDIHNVNNNTINLSDEAKGIYLIKLNFEGNSLISRIIIE